MKQLHSILFLLLVLLLSQLYVVLTHINPEAFNIDIPYKRISKNSVESETIRIKLDDPVILNQIRNLKRDEIQKTQNKYQNAITGRPPNAQEEKKKKKNYLKR
jgi:hypothetical protein